MTLIQKSISPFGDWIIFMNGVPLYKKWPTGRSMLFEKYGVPTTNTDRDNGQSAHEAEDTVTQNPYHARNPEALAAMVSYLLQDICGTVDGLARATVLFTVASDALHWQQDQKLAEFDLATLRDQFNLKSLIDLNDPVKFPTMPAEVRAPIREYLRSIPGFRPEMGYKQRQDVFDWHAQAEMDLTKLLGSLHDAYSYLFDVAEPLRIADSVYETLKEAGGVSPAWRSLLLGEQAPSDDSTASDTTRAPLEGYEDLPWDIIDVTDSLVCRTSDLRAPDIAYALLAERKRWQAEIERLRKAADYISPYLRWTIGDESPGHHPTMPSAVAAFHAAFDIDTQEKRLARMRAAMKDHFAKGGHDD